MKNIALYLMAVAVVFLFINNYFQNGKIEKLETKQLEIIELEKFRQEVDEVIVNRLAKVGSEKFDSLLIVHRIDKRKKVIINQIYALKDSLLISDSITQKIISQKINALENKLLALNKKR